jgi:hypothetical protein
MSREGIPKTSCFVAERLTPDAAIVWYAETFGTGMGPDAGSSSASAVIWIELTKTIVAAVHPRIFFFFMLKL